MILGGIIKKKFLLYIISLSFILIGFQNCGPSFESYSNSELSSQLDQNDNSPPVDDPEQETNDPPEDPINEPPEEDKPIVDEEVDPPQPNPTKNCAFEGVPINNKAISNKVFGAVPRINGKLPAEIPIGVPFDGPVPGTEYIRISSEKGNGVHYYSTSQAWNSDMTRVMIGDGSVDDNRLLDATNNFVLLPRRVSLTSDRVWSNVDPGIIYGISGGTSIYKFNIKTGERVAIYTRPNGRRISFMGKPAIPGDDSRMVFSALDENKLVSIDLSSTAIPRPVLGELPWGNYEGSITQFGLFINFDHSGKWVQVRPKGANSPLYRMTAELKNVEKLGNMCCHSDSAYNTEGQSVIAETVWQSRLRIWNIDLKTQYRTPHVIDSSKGNIGLFPSYVSGRGQKYCGKSWVLMSGEEGAGNPNYPLILYKVDGNTTTPTFKAIGGDLHSGAAKPNQSSNAGKQKATMSPDGQAVMFDSDGGVPGGELSSYILRIKK